MHSTPRVSRYRRQIVKIFGALLVCLIGCSALVAPSVSIAKDSRVTEVPAPFAPDDQDAWLARDDHLILSSSTGDHPFTVELALTDVERAKGLMYRTKMADDHGMLFDFAQSAPVYMWMKNTYIPLDMLFITKEGRIHHIVTGTTPLSESIIGSGGSVRYVLEVTKGTVARTGVRPGDFVKHQLFTPNE
ncbi:Uncharacterized ACR, COG1430 [Cohaesibacter sp. ES.047]|uniref:DUF192 domain-containing protein n=1 Tax=Cohaesibacter sp. ES.047 TaxID=1798205 RepID=UPI000BB83B08|nr:DUF192 domain-containing protein [Cohaesibacter sp. ES.047]SNY93525.1 Uncharacterized ACR, COG1430 [Cohaesibacter sp. ES.047]